MPPLPGPGARGQGTAGATPRCRSAGARASPSSPPPGPGPASRSGSMTMTLTDVDGDGRLALYVANYKTRSAMDVYPPQERAFNQVVRQVGKRFEVVPRFRKDYRVVDRPEYGMVSMQQRADPDGFYLNDGRGHFPLVPWTSGRFRAENGKPLA